jgi:preprotein translocase subunit SecA
MFGLLKRIFGTAQERMVSRYRKKLASINHYFTQYQKLSRQEVRALTASFKERIQKGETLEQLLPEAYGAVKAMCWHMRKDMISVMGHSIEWNLVPYDVQLIGAMAMFEGNISEMQTGEGKTLTASMPLYLHALTGKAVHLVTVNDYLAERDCHWSGVILQELGLTTGVLTQGVSPAARKEIYEKDVVYATASELGFDYLRDNSMAQAKESQVQRGHYFAIVDEIDSILIDEARTPLIISGPSAVSRHLYEELKEPVSTLIRLQKEQSARLATSAKQVLDELGVAQENPPKLAAPAQTRLQEALVNLWKVGKSTPRHRLLQKLRENPQLRKLLDDQDLQFYNEGYKEDRSLAISELYLVVDEKRNEFELTDKGIELWAHIHQQMHAERDASQDFVMLDLGHEYQSVDDDDSLSDDERLQRKVAIREEDARRKERAHNLRQLLRAHLLMEKDVDYIVAENKIVIIDENTGRPQPGRRFSDGLHQAIEAKENVHIQRETQTYASITLQNYFRLYAHLAGMSGTAITEEKEFKETYNIGVISVPTHLPTNRNDEDDLVFMTEREKYTAILKDVKVIHEKGRPILIGTESVETSEKLSRIFRQNGLEHTVLNAKNHAYEAEIISQAGQKNAITISTNMAGRGTDIKLGAGVAQLGGLHVIGTTRHHSRRIDRQLRGRCARMGDPGSSQFYVSFEDQLLRLFANERLSGVLQRFRPPEGEPISSSLLTRSIETAQKRVEQHHFNMRKHTLEYDNIMNVQRAEIYAFRNDILHSENIFKLCQDLMEDAASALDELISSEAEWSSERFSLYLQSHFPIKFDVTSMPQEREKAIVVAGQILAKTFEVKMNLEAQKLQFLPSDAPLILDQAMRSINLKRLDQCWQNHLLAMDHLRSEVQLRALGQKDPLMEYKHEAFALFEKLSQQIKILIAQDLFRFELVASPMHEMEDAASMESSQEPSL